MGPCPQHVNRTFGAVQSRRDLCDGAALQIIFLNHRSIVRRQSSNRRTNKQVNFILSRDAAGSCRSGIEQIEQLNHGVGIGIHGDSTLGGGAVAPRQAANGITQVVGRDGAKPAKKGPRIGIEARDADKGFKVRHLHDVGDVDDRPPAPTEVQGGFKPRAEFGKQVGQRIGVAADGASDQSMGLLRFHGVRLLWPDPGHLTTRFPKPRRFACISPSSVRSDQ